MRKAGRSTVPCAAAPDHRSFSNACASVAGSLPIWKGPAGISTKPSRSSSARNQASGRNPGRSAGMAPGGDVVPIPAADVGAGRWVYIHPATPRISTVKTASPSPEVVRSDWPLASRI